LRPDGARTGAASEAEAAAASVAAEAVIRNPRRVSLVITEAIVADQARGAPAPSSRRLLTPPQLPGAGDLATEAVASE